MLPGERQQILAGNARRLLRLETVVAGRVISPGMSGALRSGLAEA